MAPGGARQRRRSGTTGRGSLSKSPDCPLLLDAPRSGGGEPVRPVPGASEWEPLARVRRVVRKPFLAATSRRTEQGQLLRHVRRTRQHGRSLGDVDARRRCREVGAAARKQAGRSDGGGQHGGVSDQDQSGAGRRSRTGKPTTCSTTSSPESARSLQPLGRAAATRCGSAPKPRRSRDEAPPWQRGPAGRRGGAERNERREDDMEQAFEVPRGGNNSLQEIARAEQKRNDCASRIARSTPSDAR